MDTVVHLVAIRQGKPEQFERLMIQGTRDLLAAAKEAGVQRFILMSALGTTPETKDLVPYYGAKWAEEEDVKASGIPYVIFRPSFVFGREGGILPTFAKLARLAPFTADHRQRDTADRADLDRRRRRVLRLRGHARRGDRTTRGSSAGPRRSRWNEFWQRLRACSASSGGRRVHMPMWFMRANAVVTERLPGNIPLTRDLLKMLEAGDNVPADDAAQRTFGISPVALDEQLRRGTE